jgi:hypothetical protein
MALLLGALAASSLAAQESSALSYDFKLRFGLHAGDSQKTHFDNKLMGLGAQAKYSLSAFGIGGAAAAELSYDIVPGRRYNALDLSSPLVLDPSWSYDARKEKAEGFSVKLSYMAALPDFSAYGLECLNGAEWFAGLSIDRYKVFSEFKWTLRDSTGYTFGNLTSRPPLYYPDPDPRKGGSGTFHEEGADIGIGVFAGVRFHINEDLGFEVGLRNFGMKHWDFTPGPYSGSTEGKLSSGSTRGTSLEFAITVKF